MDCNSSKNGHQSQKREGGKRRPKQWIGKRGTKSESYSGGGLSTRIGLLGFICLPVCQFSLPPSLPIHRGLAWSHSRIYKKNYFYPQSDLSSLVIRFLLTNFQQTMNHCTYVVQGVFRHSPLGKLRETLPNKSTSKRHLFYIKTRGGHSRPTYFLCIGDWFRICVRNCVTTNKSHRSPPPPSLNPHAGDCTRPCGLCMGLGESSFFFFVFSPGYRGRRIQRRDQGKRGENWIMKGRMERGK